jgi:hypothetical protein
MSDAEQGDARESQATVGADVPAVPDKPSGMRRVAHILGAGLVAVVLPALPAYCSGCCPRCCRAVFATRSFIVDRRPLGLRV